MNNEKPMTHKKSRAQVSRLVETKKLKRSDNSSSFQDLGQHGMLLAAGAGTPDTNLEKQKLIFGTTVDSKLTDIIKSTKTNPRVLNLINHQTQ